MIDIIFMFFVSIITLLVMVAIIGIFLFLPLIFKYGWMIYVIYLVLAILAFFSDHNNGDKNE